MFAIGLLCACGEQPIFHTFQTVSKQGWNAKDTLYFKASIPDSQSLYTLSVEIRHRNNYPYQNLNLAIGYRLPDSTFSTLDTLYLNLVNKKLDWKGNGGSNIYQVSFPIGAFHATKVGIYTFQITHLMPDDVLPGLMDVGICGRRQSEEK